MPPSHKLHLAALSAWVASVVSGAVVWLVDAPPLAGLVPVAFLTASCMTAAFAAETFEREKSEGDDDDTQA